MANLDSWLSPDAVRALGWTLIHSLWQGLALAALAAGLMVFSRRPSVRYLIATCLLMAMLVVPVATFLVLMKSAAPSHDLPRLTQPYAPRAIAAFPRGDQPEALAAAPKSLNQGPAILLVAPPARNLPPRLLASNPLPPVMLPWLVGAWLAGVALFSLRFAGGILLLEFRCRTQSRALSPRTLSLCLDIQRQIGLDRAIRYLECGWLRAPGVVGWLRPILLLPLSVVTGLSEAQLRAVIAHELAHIRRHDFFVNLLQTLAEALLFYHPAIWWLNARIRAERELCCDEIAVSVTGDRLEYARVLALMAEWEQAPALAMAANRGPLTERIFHLLGRKPFGLSRRLLGLTGSLLFLAAALGAANALFGIAYPIAAAHAKPAVKTLSSQIAAVADAPPAPQAAAPVAKDTAPDLTGGPAPTRQIMARAETPLAPLPNLSELLPSVNLPPPTLLARNDQPMAPAPAAASCAPPKLLNSLAMTPTQGGNTMTVAARFDGKPERLLVGISDTPTQLWQSRAAALGLPVQMGPRSMDGGGRVSEEASRVGDFLLGNMKTGNFFIQVSLDPDFPDAGSDGILGTDMMMRYDIDLDFAHRRLNYFAPEACAGAGVYWSPTRLVQVPMKTYANVVYVPVTLEGRTLVAVLDTAASRTFLNPRTASQYYGLKAEALEPANLTDGGAVIKAGVHGFSSLSIGGYAFANPSIAVPFDIQSQSYKDFHAARTARNRFYLSEILPDIVIGMDVLKQTHLYVSFQNQRVYFSPAGEGQGLSEQAPADISRFNVWRFGYDSNYNFRHPDIKF